MSKHIIQKMINSVRNNGIIYVKNPKLIRQTVYLNMIWMATYSALIIFTLFIFPICGLINDTFTTGLILLHLGFIAVFQLTRSNKSALASHVLLLVTYSMITFFDHFFGKQAFMQVYFIAFMPSALNIFSYRRQKAAILTYLLLPLAILLISETYTYRIFEPGTAALELAPAVRYFNIVMGITLAVVFAGYMILTTHIKQDRLITQSVSLQATLNNATGAIWSIDTHYVLLACNKQFMEFMRHVFGIQHIKPGVSLSGFLQNPQTPEHIRDYYNRVLEGKPFKTEISLGGEDYELRAQPIINEHGIIIGGTFSGRNITMRKNAQKRLHEARKQAEVAVEAKTRFLSSMSHELRTPLNGIIGVVNIMQDEPILPAQKNNLDTLSDLSHHTLQLINNILDYSKLEAGKSALDEVRFNLRTLISRLQSIFEVTARLKKIELITEINGSADIFLKGDYTKLSQVLINLMSNAVKFTEKGYIKLAVKVTEQNSGDLVNVAVSVTDTGMGIPEKSIQLIFESFAQADIHISRRFGGTGLGLTISEKILNLMGSKLLVSSTEGKGSVFSFDTRLKKSSSHDKVLLPSTAESRHFEPLPLLNILLAEDNLINQRVARKIIEKWGVAVTVAGNGAEAVQRFDNSEFDLVLMDLDMPVMDGYQATAAIRTTNNEVPIVALTAAIFDDMEQYLTKKGFSGVVQKPFMPRELYNTIVQRCVKTSSVV